MSFPCRQLIWKHWDLFLILCVILCRFHDSVHDPFLTWFWPVFDPFLTSFRLVSNQFQTRFWPVQKGNLEKTQEFFQKQALELQGQAEWRDWFILPFIPTPEQNPAFGPYFSRQWADTFLVSLHNFLSVLFQCMHILHRKPQLQINRLNEAINQSDRFV